MKITFIVPGLNLTGGLRVVAKYSELLSDKGHEVTVVAPGPAKPTIKQRLKSVMRWKGYKFEYTGFINTGFFSNVNYHVKVLNSFRHVNAEDIPDSDFVIATYWNTAEWVADYPESKGKKVYFVQGYEVHPWLPVGRVKQTLQLPLKKITIAQWLADILENDFHQKNISIIHNAVDHRLFYASKRKKNIAVTFGMVYSSRSIKGSQLAFECFNQLQKEYSSNKLIVFGMEPLNEVVGLPNNATYYFQPEQGKIRDIYSQCDVWLFTSSSEGFGLPILEAMACRTPVIGTRCGAAPDLLESGGGILIDIEDNEGLLSAMKILCNMSKTEWLNMSNKAYQEAMSHQWDDKVEQFERALTND